MNESLKDLRIKAEQATPGPWTTGCYDDRYMSELYVDGPKALIEGCVGRPIFIKDADALFIAAANPQIVLTLLDRIEKYEAALREIRDSVIERRSEALRNTAHEALIPEPEEKKP